MALVSSEASEQQHSDSSEVKCNIALRYSNNPVISLQNTYLSQNKATHWINTKRAAIENIRFHILYRMPETIHFLICTDQNESFFLDKVLPQHLQFTHTSEALRNRYGQSLLTRQRQQKKYRSRFCNRYKYKTICLH